MLMVSMGVSIDGFITDRDGGFAWGPPSDEQFDFHLEQVSGLGGLLLGRRLYETMLPWETDPAMRSSDTYAAFADVWTALPKVVFSRTLDRVERNARLADAPLEEEIARMLAATDRDVEIGGPTLAAPAIEQGLVDEFHLFRQPVLVGGGTRLLPPVRETIQLELLATRTFGDRVVYEHYRRVGAAA
ncbi:dihydrofolate reductase family protein [Microbacterium sp. NPDC019599]|uniref:dihydrofolate reductase family protein n=1 Tax=Microbacterium sp. NPDC019599 TaxID=3154690 RepID=UPI0033F69BFA